MKKIFISSIILIIGVVLFYNFMTYDRNYTWSKVYKNQLEEITETQNLEFEKLENISTKDIKLPNERWIKLKIQKNLSKVDLMSYGREFGEKITYKSKNSEQKLIFKALCLSDHLIGIEVEYENIDQHSLNKIKTLLENQFSNYELVWTKI